MVVFFWVVVVPSSLAVLPVWPQTERVQKYLDTAELDAYGRKLHFNISWWCEKKKVCRSTRTGEGGGEELKFDRPAPSQTANTKIWEETREEVYF